jgi:hypothetical protein
MCMTRVNGSALSRRAGFLLKSRGNSGRLNPIDTRVAPEDGQRVACLKEIKAIATISARVAVVTSLVCGRLTLAATVTKCA